MEGFILDCKSRIKATRSAIAVFSIALLCSACASPLDVGWTPVQGGLLSPVQICSEDTNVYGMRVSLLYGENPDVYGFDFGVAGSSKRVAGLQTNILYNRTEGLAGIQSGPFYNQAVDVRGSQQSIFYNSAENVSDTFSG